MKSNVEKPLTINEPADRLDRDGSHLVQNKDSFQRIGPKPIKAKCEVIGKLSTLPSPVRSNINSPTRLFDNLVTKADLARSLSISVSYVNKLMRLGIPHHKIGTKLVRFDRSEVAAWLQKRRQA